MTHQVTDFVERLMKHASNGEVLMFKKPLDARLHQLIASNPELNLATVAELEFISNFQAIQVCPPRPARPLFHPIIILKVVLLQVGVKNQFGYVKSKPESGNKGGPGDRSGVGHEADGTRSPNSKSTHPGIQSGYEQLIK